VGALSWFPDGQNTTALFCFAFSLSFFIFFFFNKGLSHHVIIISATSSFHTGADAVFIDFENCINIHMQLSAVNSEKQSLMTQ